MNRQELADDLGARMESWFEKRYGRLLTREEMRAAYDMSGLGRAFVDYWRNPSPRQFPKGHVRKYDPTGQYTYADQNPLFKE